MISGGRACEREFCTLWLHGLQVLPPHSPPACHSGPVAVSPCNSSPYRMRSRYGALAIYSTLLACVAVGALLLALRGVDLPPWWVVLPCIGACLFVWQFGLRAPRLGLISMERLPQIGLLLVFEPAVAASICARGVADLALGQPSLQPGLAQGRHAARYPQRVDDGADAHARGLRLSRLPAGATLCHGTARDGSVRRSSRWRWPHRPSTSCLMALFFRFDGREVRRIVTPSYALSDPIFVPAGILAGRALQHRQHGGVLVVRRPDAAVRAELQQHRFAS